jgi:hypothetical protein
MARSLYADFYKHQILLMYSFQFTALIQMAVLIKHLTAQALTAQKLMESIMSMM